MASKYAGEMIMWRARTTTWIMNCDLQKSWSVHINVQITNKNRELYDLIVLNVRYMMNRNGTVSSAVLKCPLEWIWLKRLWASVCLHFSLSLIYITMTFNYNVLKSYYRKLNTEWILMKIWLNLTIETGSSQSASAKM